jgi:hypothetical protein
MTAVVACTDVDTAIAARVAAWLTVGGSWDAIATAHGATDVDAFRQRVEPHLHPSDGALAAPARHERPGQLRLF